MEKTVKQLKKKSRTAKEIFDEIADTNEHNIHHFKHFIPHFIYVSNEEKVELLAMGFKLTEGEWLRGEMGLIIEW